MEQAILFILLLIKVLQSHTYQEHLKVTWYISDIAK